MRCSPGGRVPAGTTKEKPEFVHVGCFISRGTSSRGTVTVEKTRGPEAWRRMRRMSPRRRPKPGIPAQPVTARQVSFAAASST